MVTDRFRESDSKEFLRLAEMEGWISDAWELGFLLEAFPQGCLVKRFRGFPAAFITAIRYGRSGWIGNLLVHPELRRRGIGAELMTEAIETLEHAGVETVWLTASPSGKPLYERLGFKMIDRVQRWIGDDFEVIIPCGRRISRTRAGYLDAAGWGDCRSLLIDALTDDGEMACGPDSFLVTRKVGTMRQIGPWTGTPEAARSLFERNVEPSPGGDRICLDVPSGNKWAEKFLEQSGFTVDGATVLMYRGVEPSYRPELIGALASMGSMG